MTLHTSPAAVWAAEPAFPAAPARAITVASLLPLHTPGSGRRRLLQQQSIAHRRERNLSLGPDMRLQFEDERTVRHQILEVLRAERITDAAEIQREIDTYAHLLPDGTQWKATLLIELPDATERAASLPRLSEAAHRLYVSVPQHARVFALANEDLEDRHLTRPSGVHFLRFPLPVSLRDALRAGAPATLGCDHDQYQFRRLIPPATLQQLCTDLAVPA